MVRNTYEVQNIGDLLREKRKQLGLDIKQVSAETKIRAEYLLALESGDFAKFPASVYAKGFLKKYSKYLGINPDRAAAMYRREENTTEQDSLQNTEFLKTRLQASGINITPARIFTVITLVLLVGFAFYLISQASTVLQNPEINISEPIEGSAGDELIYATESETITIAGSVEPGSQLTINGSEVTVNNLQEFEVTDLELQPGENNFQLLATNQFGRESSINLLVVREVSEIPESTPSEEPDAEAIDNSDDTEVAEADDLQEEVVNQQSLNTVVQVLDRDSYVQVTVDGNPVFAQTIDAGSNQEFTASEELTVSSPRFNAINVRINEQEFALQNAREHRFYINDQGIVEFEVL
jgi:transcriptional regulator with XRE-family HTH domain